MIYDNGIKKNSTSINTDFISEYQSNLRYLRAITNSSNNRKDISRRIKN